MKTCVMNCGPSTKDMRSRADVMRDCQDCEEWPEPRPTQSEADQLLATVLSEYDNRAFTWPTHQRIRDYLKARQR